MNLIIDIDDTLLLYPNKTFENIIDKYNAAYPDHEEIRLLNERYNKGDLIILHTGRNWDKYHFTKKQLEKFGIKHHELVMGKPQGIYVDRDSYKSIKDIFDD
jgi:hypothetical protein